MEGPSVESPPSRPFFGKWASDPQVWRFGPFIAVEQWINIARQKILHLLGCPSNECRRHCKIIKSLTGEAERLVRRNPIEEVIVIRAFVHSGPRVHRMAPNSFVEVLSVAALSNTSDQRLLNNQERKLSPQSPINHRLMHNEALRHVANNQQNCISTQERFGKRKPTDS